MTSKRKAEATRWFRQAGYDLKAAQKRPRRFVPPSLIITKQPVSWIS